MNDRPDLKTTRGEFVIGNPPKSETRRPKYSTLWLITAAALCVAIGACIMSAITQRQLDEARAQAADLQNKLEEQTTGHNKCMSQNVDLITWKLQSQTLLLQAADYLNFCADLMPGHRFPRIPHRKLDFGDDAIPGAPPQ